MDLNISFGGAILAQALVKRESLGSWKGDKSKVWRIN